MENSRPKYFFEYNDTLGYPTVNKVVYPHCPMGEDGDHCFLVYATDEKEAFSLAMKHKYSGKPFDRFYGTYNDEKYENVKCVM